MDPELFRLILRGSLHTPHAFVRREGLMSVRIAAAVAVLMLWHAVADPAVLVRADESEGTAKKSPPVKSPEKVEREELRATMRKIQARLRMKQPAERVSAVRQLHDYPSVDSAKMLVTIGLVDNEPSVREAAYYTLLDLKDDEPIARYLFLTMKKDARRAAVNPTTLQLLAVLLSSTMPEIDRDVTAYVEKQTGTHDGLVLVEALADQLGDHGQAEDVVPLKKLIALKIFPAHFGLRRAISDALMKISAPEAIGQLVDLLEKVKGEIHAEIVKHLTELTGQELGEEAVAWREWWKENEKTFQLVAGALQRKEGNPLALTNAPGSSRYYGLSIYAEKMVFIIDTSSSMRQGGRLVAAKRELLQAIDGLSEEAQFSVLAFNGDVYAWHKQLMPANSAMKQAAGQWISALEMANTTASYDALDAAMQFDTEAIYFLTDGVPQGGVVNDPADIVTLITRANATRRLSIYTIGIGVAGPQGSAFDNFLTALARHNRGVYRRVDN